MFLSRLDVVRLTKRERYSAQRRALDRLGVRYTVAADGEPLVSEVAIDGAGRAAHPRVPKWHRLSA